MDKKLSAGLFRRMQIYSKEMQMSRFTNAGLETNSESDSEAEAKSVTELMAKLKSDFEP